MGTQREPRRRVLQLVGLGLTVGVGGCVNSDEDDADSGTNGSGTDNETDTTTVSSGTPAASDSFGIVAGYPVQTEDGTENRRETVLSPGDFSEVGEAQDGRAGRPPYVQVTLTQSAAERFVAVLQERGFTDEGVGSCRWQDDPDDPGWCLYTVVDGEITYAASLSPALADTMSTGEFQNNPAFVLQTATLSDAEELERVLAGES